MFGSKKLKRIMSLLMIMLIAANSAYAAYYSVPEELNEYGQQIHSSARYYGSRSSFNGYCGAYVRCKLRAVGIFKDKYDLSGNGNQWYSLFGKIDVTSGGYYVYRESGGDCIDKLVEKYGNNLSNIVISFPIQSGYSAARPGAGHVIMLYELRDGIAYYSESFSFGQYREGQVVAEDIKSLLARYSRRHGQPNGCVLLSQNPNMGAQQMEGYDTEQAPVANNVLKAQSVFMSGESTAIQMSQPRVPA